MKNARYLVLSVLTVEVLWATFVQRSPSGAARSVAVACIGATNDAAGNTVYCFQVTNSLAVVVHGCYTAVEVYHDGIWFNALPQPKSSTQWQSNGVTYVKLPELQPNSATTFTVAPPTGRAEEGLQVQPNPPGEKWRAHFSYTAPKYPQTAFPRLIRRLKMHLRLNTKIEENQYYAFSPGIPFSPANPQGGANERQPLRSGEDRASASAASRRSP